MKHWKALALIGSFVAAVAAGDSISESAAAPLDLVARAGGQELTGERLAMMLAVGKLPINREGVEVLAGLWVNYQLVGLAGARGDSLDDPALIDDAMWAKIDQALAQKYFLSATNTQIPFDTTGLTAKYAQSPILAAQHILISVPEGAPKVLQDSQRAKAERIRRVVTSANFAAMAAQYTDEAAGRDRAGQLGVFVPGIMVAEFELAVRTLRPGQITPVPIKTQFGYHIIRRHLLSEVRAEFIDQLRAREAETRTDEFVKKLEVEYALAVTPALVAAARAVGRDVDAGLHDTTALATSRFGSFTARHLARWLQAYPPQAMGSYRQQLMSGPDTTVIRIVRTFAGKQLVVSEARKTNIALEPGELTIYRGMFRHMLSSTGRGLRVDPKSLSDSARTTAERERLAAARADHAIEQVMATNGQTYVEVPQELASAIRTKYPWGVNRAVAERVAARALAIRVAMDSARTPRGS